MRASRKNTGKLQWSQIDFELLEDLVRVLEFGEKKYTAGNWRKGMPTAELCESLLRHTFAFMQGEDNDPESGISHIGHIMSNAMFLAYNVKKKKEFDNRNRYNNGNTKIFDKLEQ
jgi:hypothetical protein